MLANNFNIEEDNLIPYKFEYRLYNEYHSFELYSNEKYLKEELQKIQDKILKQILLEQKATFKKIKEDDTGFEDWLYSESDIVERIKDILIKQYNFIEVNYNNILYTSMEDWYEKYIQLKEPKIKFSEEGKILNIIGQKRKQKYLKNILNEISDSIMESK